MSYHDHKKISLYTIFEANIFFALMTLHMITYDVVFKINKEKIDINLANPHNFIAKMFHTILLRK